MCVRVRDHVLATRQTERPIRASSFPSYAHLPRMRRRAAAYACKVTEYANEKLVAAAFLVKGTGSLSDARSFFERERSKLVRFFYSGFPWIMNPKSVGFSLSVDCSQGFLCTVAFLAFWLCLCLFSDRLVSLGKDISLFIVCYYLFLFLKQLNTH